MVGKFKPLTDEQLTEVANLFGLDPLEYIKLARITEALAMAKDYVVVALIPLEGENNSDVKVWHKGSVKLEDMHEVIDFAVEHQNTQNDIIDQVNDLLT